MSETGGGSLFPMDLLLFSAAGFDFGVEAAQVKQMAAWNGEDDEGIFDLGKELVRRRRAGDKGGMVIEVATGAGSPFRALIDRVEELVAIAATDIRPFPALIEPLALRRGMWGVYPQNGRLFLLLDFARMKLRRPAGAGEETTIEE